jgi:predicted glycoside hydrolase/deacetylase ChbG (UPF0249 family)
LKRECATWTAGCRFRIVCSFAARLEPTCQVTVRVHADDLGLHPAVDRAVFRAYERGALAGASILTTGPTFAEAARVARSIGIPLGLHLALVDTRPLSAPGDISSLVDADGRFPNAYPSVVGRALRGRLHAADLQLEIGRQMQAFGDAGLIGPAGLLLDGHQHLHLLPVIFRNILAVGPTYMLRAFRLPTRSPHEQRNWGLRSVGFAVAEALGKRARAAAKQLGIGAVPCWGGVYAGHLTLATARAVLDSLPASAEGQLLCHPGDDDGALQSEHPWGYTWEAELATVMALSAERAA